jgi:hypothetical protein
MPDITEQAPLRVRLAWFLAIAAASAFAVAIVAEGLRLLILPRS